MTVQHRPSKRALIPPNKKFANRVRNARRKACRGKVSY